MANNIFLNALCCSFYRVFPAELFSRSNSNMKQLLKPTIIFLGLLYTLTGKTFIHDSPYPTFSSFSTAIKRREADPSLN
jgi:hypothetical protein